MRAPRRLPNSFRQRIAGDNGHYLKYHDVALGVIELARGDFDAAIEYLEGAVRGIELVDGGGDRLWLARAYLEAGRLGEAVETFESALDRGTNVQAVLIDHVQGYYYLGVAYDRSGWKKKAVENYERYLDILKNADPGIRFVDDARERLQELRADS